MKKLIIIIIAAVVVLGGGAAAVFLFVLPGDDTIEYFYYNTGEAFVTNIVDSEFLVKAPITLEMTQDLTEDLTKKNAVVRDCIMRVLLHTPEEVYKSGNLDQVSTSIVNELNAKFPPEDPEDPPIFSWAYFSDFVMN